MKYRYTVLLGCLAFFASANIEQIADAYSLSGRWDTTASSGGGLQLGDATTITWSIMPDGSDIPGDGISDMVSFLDTVIGAGPGGSDLTQRPWFSSFEQSFGRWDELSGITYVYEPNDDGVDHATLDGELGVRGDARIGGTFIDGQSGSNVLAYNYFPDNGDMAIDTGNINFYGDTSNNAVRLRNVLMHEAGHGLGYGHIESNDSEFLMEPFININFDGPQMDEIRGIHRGYGDRLEENGGNDVIGNAASLGSVASGMSMLSVGTDAHDGTIVAADDVDFVSIDDNGDVDFFSFEVGASGDASFVLSPKGPTYSQGPQGGGQNIFNAKTVSDLGLAVYDSNQNLITSVDSAGVGVDETLNNVGLDSPGTYYVRVTGDANNVQLYTLDVEVNLTGTTIDGDFDDDGDYACSDVDGLVAEIAGGSNTASFDLTGDGLVNGDDLGAWLAEAGAENLALVEHT